MGYSAVCQMVKRFILDSGKNTKLKLRVEQFEKEVRNY